MIFVKIKIKKYISSLLINFHEGKIPFILNFNFKKIILIVTHYPHDSFTQALIVYSNIILRESINRNDQMKKIVGLKLKISRSCDKFSWKNIQKNTYAFASLHCKQKRITWHEATPGFDHVIYICLPNFHKRGTWRHIISIITALGVEICITSHDTAL